MAKKYHETLHTSDDSATETTFLSFNGYNFDGCFVSF